MAFLRNLLLTLLVITGIVTADLAYSGPKRSSKSKTSESGARTTHVKGYYRKDGTYVAPHERRLPGTASSTYDPPASTSNGGRTQVKGYYRKDGTWVAPYSRSNGGGNGSYESPRPARRSISSGAWKQGARAAAPFYGMERDKHGRFVRRASARSAFMRLHPCPSTGETSGPCPGYVVDHITALKRGGPDSPSNMQWQTIEAAKAKDAWE